jgi:ribosomal-protein-alanine N-acetyltransferase
MNKISSKKIIRWMKPEDINQVVDFCSVSKLSIKKFINKPNGICIVSTLEERVVGFVFYEIKKQAVKLHCISVHPDFRRDKLGSEMILDIILKSKKSNKKILAKVSEYNLPAQLFFKNLGFEAKKVMRDAEGDIYCFEYKGTFKK